VNFSCQACGWPPVRRADTHPPSSQSCAYPTCRKGAPCRSDWGVCFGSNLPVPGRRREWQLTALPSRPRASGQRAASPPRAAGFVGGARPGSGSTWHLDRGTSPAPNSAPLTTADRKTRDRTERSAPNANQKAPVLTERSERVSDRAKRALLRSELRNRRAVIALRFAQVERGQT
jgi:hypothetical protein